jgi:hypothetical protein
VGAVSATTRAATDSDRLRLGSIRLECARCRLGGKRVLETAPTPRPARWRLRDGYFGDHPEHFRIDHPEHFGIEDIS